MVRFIVFLLIFGFGLTCNAQFTKDVTVGDVCPDIVLKNIQNYSSNSIRLSDLRGKLIIFDFSTTNCVPCMRLLPKIDSLRKLFLGRVEFFMVTPEKRQYVTKYLKVKVPVITQDSLLHQYFKHLIVPHEVWIDGAGVVKAITGHEYISEKNIQTILDGKTVNWPVKRESKIYNYNQPLLLLNSNARSIVGYSPNIYYSAFGGNLEGLYSRYLVQKDSTRNISRVSMINLSIIDIYLRAWNQVAHLFPVNRIILEVPDSGKYIYNGKEPRAVWERQNTYSYELVLPITVPDNERQSRIKMDLNYFFGVNGRMEKRIIRCWILLQDSSTQRTKNQFGDIQEDVSVSSFMIEFNNDRSNPPIINESNLSERELQQLKVKLKDKKRNNLPLMIDEFKKIGLKLIEAEREIDVFVISK